MNLSLLSVLAASLAAAPGFCLGAGVLLDPVVTHTNGMRLASTTADRSHNVYWRCDPNHLGYCEGRYQSPCRNDLRSLGTRHGGEFAPPCTQRGAIAGQAVHFPDGLETTTSEPIGPLPLEDADGRVGAASGGSFASSSGAAVGTLPAAAAAAPTGAPGGTTAGGLWIDALQTLGRKVMATPPDDGA